MNQGSADAYNARNSWHNNWNLAETSISKLQIFCLLPKFMCRIWIHRLFTPNFQNKRLVTGKYRYQVSVLACTGLISRSHVKIADANQQYWRQSSQHGFSWAAKQLANKVLKLYDKDTGLFCTLLYCTDCL